MPVDAVVPAAPVAPPARPSPTAPVAPPADPLPEPPADPSPGPTPATPGPTGAPVGALCDFQHTLTPWSMRLNPTSQVCDSQLCLYTGMDVARCTDFCAVDSDCPDPTPDCPDGFICVARFAVGPPACCRLCICRRALHPAERRDLFSCLDRTCDFSVED